MSISLHCESCKRKIKAPDSAGGKWGSCPFCNHRCYIPRPPSPDDKELKLAPIGESEEDRYNRLMRETRDLRQNVLQERATLNEDELAAVAEISEAELLKQIILYLRYLADGDLGMATGPMTAIKPHANAAMEVLEEMAKAERPEPELQDIPPRVLQGLIKKLYAKLR